MKAMRKLAWVCFSFGAAAAIYVALLPGLWGFALSAACLITFLGLLLGKRKWSRLCLAFLGLALGFCWTAGFDLFAIAPVRSLAGQSVSITATLHDDPQPTKAGVSVYADAELGGHDRRLLVYLQEDPGIRAGDRLQTEAFLALPEGEDYELYYRSIGVDLIAYARGEVQVLPGDEFRLSSLPLSLRRALKEKIEALFPADSAPFVKALLIGDRSGLSYAQRNALSISGIAHTVAISGMHVSILLGLVMLLCGNRRWLSALIGIPVVLLFTLMVGAVPSVIRAAVMQILLLLAPLLRRENDPATSLGAAMLIILLPNPWAVANLSFQLSFAAMAGILLFAGKIYRRLSDFFNIKGLFRVPIARQLVSYVLGCLCSTFSASVFTLPLIAWQFSTVSLLSPLTNLLTLWAVSFVFEGALLCCLLGFVWAGPAKLLAGGLAFLVRYILAVAEGLARLPLSAVYTDNVYILLWLIFCYVLAGCFFLGGRKRLLSYGCTAVLSLCLCVFLGYFDSAGASLRFTMLDVEQGQCLVFQDSGVTLMYDCGTARGDQAGETAARFLLSQGIGRVDILVLSHYDADHAGGVCQLMDRTQVDLLYLPDLPSPVREEIEEAAAKQGTALRYVTQNEQLSFGSSRVKIFAPVMTQKENDASLALLYSQGSYDILATGDMSSAAERLLLTNYKLPNVEVLVAGHHGSATSTCQTLLELTQPETVLISVGENNSYGHPAEETLARIEDFGAELYRTDLCGNIMIKR